MKEICKQKSCYIQLLLDPPALRVLRLRAFVRLFSGVID